jgi:hypothetical protein
LQMLRHSYCRVAGLRTWRCEHCEVPRGGNCAGCIGAMEGGVGMQVIIGQIGGKSIELLHSGCTSPSTQRQTHDACALAVRKAPKATVKISRPISSSINLRGLRSNHSSKNTRGSGSADNSSGMRKAKNLVPRACRTWPRTRSDRRATFGRASPCCGPCCRPCAPDGGRFCSQPICGRNSAFFGSRNRLAG